MFVLLLCRCCNYDVNIVVGMSLLFVKVMCCCCGGMLLLWWDVVVVVGGCCCDYRRRCGKKIQTQNRTKNKIFK